MPYYIKERKRWMGQVIHLKKTYRKGFPTKKEAKAWEVRKKQDLRKSHILKTPTTSLIELSVSYLDYSREKHSVKTYQEKRYAFKQLLKSISPDTAVESIHKGEILEHLRNEVKGRSGNAANKDRKNLISAWNWGKKYIQDFPNDNPFDVERFPEKRSPRYIPPQDDFWKVVAVVESDQDELMLYCYLHLAARRSEIFNLKWSDINFGERKVRLFTRKRRDGSSEYDWLPLTEFLFARFEKHEEQRNKDQILVFPNPKTGLPYRVRRRWMKGLCENAGVKSFGLHAIRHLSASILMEHDVPLLDIKTILRHKNITTTEKYIHRLKSVRESISVFDIGGK